MIVLFFVVMFLYFVFLFIFHVAENPVDNKSKLYSTDFLFSIKVLFVPPWSQQQEQNINCKNNKIKKPNFIH